MNKKILWLASIYPNKLSPLDGDFIQRHARAVAELREIEVLFVVKDAQAKVTRTVKEETFQEGLLTERIIYYHPPETGILLLDKFLSHMNYMRIFKKKITSFLLHNEKPDFVHVHMAMKAGLPALWLQKNHNIPFLISEHWTGYLPEANPGPGNPGLLQRKLFKRIFREAVHLTTVSAFLGKAIRNRFGIPFQVIPNVVNTQIFYPVYRSNGASVRFIHISTNKKQKNTSDILKALSILKKQGETFSMSFFLPDAEAFRKQVDACKLNQEVTVYNEVSQSELAKHLNTSDALVLFSDYETFGCVVIEANACGLPCILSDLEVFKEYSVEKETAIYAKKNDVQDLAKAMKYIIENKETFNRDRISSYIQKKFAYPVVANTFNILYEKLEESLRIRKF